MGSCCGADREAVSKAAAGGGKAAGFLDFLNEFCERLESWPCLVASALALVISFFLTGHGCGIDSHDCATSPIVFDTAWIALFLCGLPILKEAVLAIVIERKIRAALLISTAMIACCAIGQLFAAGEVAFIMALGEKLEGWTVARAKTGLRKLVSLVPATARRLVTCPKCLARGELYHDVRVEEIAVGDGVRVLPGETIPVDGIIEEGSTSVDQSVMTGEALPVDKVSGDAVYSGTINRFGAITVRVTKAGEDSSLQSLIRLVREAEKRKAPMQKLADRWASILVPCSMTIALATFAFFLLTTGDTHLALLRGVTIMVVFCPCALVLATPTSIMAAIGQATKHGVIIKSGEALERMGLVSVACLDKTGTLTSGRLAVSDIVASASGAATEAQVLAFAAAVEVSSEHPLAQAIVARQRESGSDCAGAPVAASASDFMMTPGRGVQARVAEAIVLCGKASWLEEHGIAISKEDEEAAAALRREGKAVVAVARDGKLLGFVALSDTLRPDASALVKALPAAGLRPVLLTGDHAASAAFVANALGIDDVRADLLPAGKSDAIVAIEAAGERVCMVGDGVNDAPALKTATVGIAMGGMGSDIAVEAADIALVGDDLGKITYLKRLSNACVRLIKFNIALSMIINACAITLSILGLLTPVTGALVHNLGSSLVVLNAALLYDRKFD